jgi:DNA-binding response OmpR family regulator
MYQILVVSNDGVGLSAMLNVFQRAGYRAIGASTFEEARQRLDSAPPDLVIADERLGEFNGLHVLLTARAENPHTAAIVTTPKRDLALEADARSLNVHCVVKPRKAHEWLGRVASYLPAEKVA